jgi:hypothetical protein
MRPSRKRKAAAANTVAAPLRAARSTVEALMFSLRSGVAKLGDPKTQGRLSELDDAQMFDVAVRLQKFKAEIAPAWTPEDVAVLVAVRKKLK